MQLQAADLIVINGADYESWLAFTSLDTDRLLDTTEAIKNQLGEHPAQLMIWEAPSLPSVLERLRQQGVRSIVFEPSGNRPETGDYLAVMNPNLARLSAYSQNPH